MEEIRKYPNNDEEIEIFYCLVLKNEEEKEIRVGGGRNKEMNFCQNIHPREENVWDEISAISQTLKKYIFRPQ